MRMSSTGIVLFAFMFSVFVCEANSYNDAVGKPKGYAYRGGANISGPNHSSLNQCHVGDSFFRELIDRARTVQGTEQQAAYKTAWSGTQKDLNDVVANAKKQYGFEDLTHLGRNATMAVPASLTSMALELQNGNPNGWKVEGRAYFHQPGTTTIVGPNVKFTNSAGDEVVYNMDTKWIVPNQYMGTKNFEHDYRNNAIDHSLFDIVPHFKDSNYKYVGILYERDTQDPDKYYIIDGQTGLPMNPRQVAEFPTTLSDMWKEMGQSCAKSDSEDVKGKNAPVRAIADGMKQGWEMGGPVGAIGGAVGGGVAAGHIASIENKEKSGKGAEDLQVQANQHHDEMNFYIDTSKLEELLKEGILFLKGLIAKGKRATNSQIDAHNQRVKEMLAETVSIVKRIDSLGISDEEKKSIAEKVFESVKGLNSQFDSLNKQARSMGLVRGATTEEQIELITDVQGKADVVSVDLSKSETESIKSKSNDVSYNPDFDVCKCAVPDDRDFRCKKCGKMSKCLAPYRDKEFERMLNNRK